MIKPKALFLAMSLCSFTTVASNTSDKALQQEMQRLQQQAVALQTQLNHLQAQLAKQSSKKVAQTPLKSSPRRGKTERSTLPTASHQIKKRDESSVKSEPLEAKSNVPKIPMKARPIELIHQSPLSVYRPDNDPESLEFYPTALMADEHVVTYIAGTPVVTSPYLGSRPAFDGSDYIVNISSINRDIRLMQQRRRLYRAYEHMGYPIPNVPIIALSGKVEPNISVGEPFYPDRTADANLGSGELDTAAILNDKVEAYLSLAYDSSPPSIGGQRLSNSSIDLNMGFVNIGDLDESPLYFTGGQLFVPFGRFSSAMVSAPFTMILARTKSRPFIVGYKSQRDTGPYAAFYGFRSDTTLGNAATGGVNLGYNFDSNLLTGEVGASFISGMNDAGGMQFTGSIPGTTFGGFSSITNGNESVHKVPAAGVHGSMSISRFNFIAEWVGATERFRPQDLSFNGQGALPQALQLEAGVTFKTFDKPASVALGYQWAKETLALNIPQQRIAGVFNISIWKDTVESLEYRHDINYANTQYANGAAPPGLVNTPTIGQGGSSDTLLAQIGVYF